MSFSLNHNRTANSAVNNVNSQTQGHHNQNHNTQNRFPSPSSAYNNPSSSSGYNGNYYAHQVHPNHIMNPQENSWDSESLTQTVSEETVREPIANVRTGGKEIHCQKNVTVVDVQVPPTVSSTSTVPPIPNFNQSLSNMNQQL